jgi:uncharacterized protein with ParB-like and HNH nuclease domain
MQGIQDTSSRTLRQLLGNGLRYNIPKFQRDYSWTMEQWDDLWQDIDMVRNGEEPAHYLGYLVLQTQDDKNYKVIDGQQRMTTLSVLILAVIKVLQDLVESGVNPKQNTARIDSFRSSYIGYLDPVTLVSQNKLTLNRNNDDFYRQKLVPLQRLPQRGLNSSEKLMRDCFIWFHNRLKQQFTTGESVAGYLDEIIDKLFFTVITVNDELNAFRVFETLNARGVQLSSADLLKNYLFSIVDTPGSHASEIAEIESLWSKVIAKLGNQKFPEFLRVYWNSRNKTVRKSELFKVIRRSIRNKQEAFQLIRKLENSADIYIALRNPGDELWITKPDISQFLEALKLFQVRQPIALLLASYEHLDKSNFTKILKAIVMVSFRYNVIGGLNPNDQEVVYNQSALKIRRGESFSFAWLDQIYPEDDSFETAFSNIEFKRTARGHKIIRYILGNIEKQLYQNPIDYQSATFSIEHILPENPEEGAWDHIPDDTLDRCVYRLGNLALLEKNLNKDANSKGYAHKREILTRSSVQSTANIPNHYDQWNEQSIISRQRQLARVAKGIWRLH